MSRKRISPLYCYFRVREHGECITLSELCEFVAFYHSRFTKFILQPTADIHTAATILLVREYIRTLERYYEQMKERKERKKKKKAKQVVSEKLYSESNYIIPLAG